MITTLDKYMENAEKIETESLTTYAQVLEALKQVNEENMNTDKEFIINGLINAVHRRINNGENIQL